MIRRLPVWLVAAAALAPWARAAERNLWPFWVESATETGAVSAWQAVGPLFFSQPGPQPGSRVSGFRPFFLQTTREDGTTASALYPFFTWQRHPDLSTFSFFQLVNRRTAIATDGSSTQGFDIWPFLFSRETGDPETSYLALFPVAGTIKQRLGYDRFSWVAFPLYARSHQGAQQVTYAPWPFIRSIAGDGYSGFELWPLYGRREHAGDFRREFWLWPLAYRQVSGLASPVPETKVGVLPFFTRETGPGYASATYLWPLFGATHRTEPSRYDETRYLWPFLVQGRGEHKQVNRWAPLFSHSVVKGYDKTWFLWPLWRSAHWEDDGIAQRQDQLLFFLWWSLEQRSLTSPEAPPASKRHLWPLVSTWDNGAGRRQVQVLSPLEVFFPRNDTIRQLYTPLFALWRYDERGPDERHWSLLWRAVTSHRTPAGREFHLGPLFSWQRRADGTRIALGRGLLGLARPAEGRGWRLFALDFDRPRESPLLARAPATP